MENSLYKHLFHPQHCFCHVPSDELKKWAVKHYCEHYSTVDLLESTNDPHEKEIISIVALLDVDEEMMIKMMGNVNKPDHHIIHCRERVRAIVKAECGKA